MRELGQDVGLLVQHCIGHGTFGSDAGAGEAVQQLKRRLGAAQLPAGRATVSGARLTGMDSGSFFC